MNKYHINPNSGEVGQCWAQRGKCPFGEADRHYHSPAEARAAYEILQEDFYRGVKTYPKAIEFSKDVRKLLTVLEEQGLTPLIVGGSVRDALATGITSKDVDIEVFGADSVEKLAAILKDCSYKVDDVGKSFGVLKSRLRDGTDLDISLPRRDSLVGEGHRGFEVEVDSQLSLADAASRRDFTINALYYSVSRGALLDAFGGVADWRNGILRKTSEAFSEDPLRVLRAAQFASRFNLKVSQDTVVASKEIASTFGSLSSERVQEEFGKLFSKGKNTTAALLFLHQSGWAKHFHLSPGKVDDQGEKVDRTLIMAGDRFPREVFGASALLRSVDLKHRSQVAQLIVVGKKEQEKALALSMSQKPLAFSRSGISRWARSLAENNITVEQWCVANEAYVESADVDKIQTVALEAQCYRGLKPDLVTGKMILAKSSKPQGPWMGKLIHRARQSQDLEKFTTLENAQAWLDRELSRLT